MHHKKRIIKEEYTNEYNPKLLYIIIDSINIDKDKLNLNFVFYKINKVLILK